MSGKNSGITKLPGGGESIDLDRYVTDKSVDGLYHYIAEQKKSFVKIRLNKVVIGCVRFLAGKLWELVLWELVYQRFMVQCCTLCEI